VVAGELGDLSREELVALARWQRAELEARDRQVRRLAARVAELEEANAELGRRLERLERLISRNSANSSMPPSRDEDPGRKKPQPKERKQGGRKPGGQPGAPGRHLPWSPQPDAVVHRFPEGTCRCGHGLADAADLGVRASHQVIDLPEVRPGVTQYDLHAVACAGCGAGHAAAAPAEVCGKPGTVCYGPGLIAWAIYLMVAHHIPAHRCAMLLSALTGQPVSPGWVHGLIRRAARAVWAANVKIRALLILAPVAAADETPIRAGPKGARKYLLTACTPLLTVYMIGDRTLESFEKFVLADLSGVLAHDRYQNYDAAAFAALTHQLCCQHLIRDLEDARETCPKAIWPGQIQDALRGLIHQANLAREKGLTAVPEEIAAPLIRAYKHGVLVGLASVPRRPGRRQPRHRALLEALRNRQDDILRFVSDLSIPPTSNGAGQAIRCAKLLQNTSGRLTSQDVTADRYAIMGYISTAAKHGASVFTALANAIRGQPWMPPDPAPA
jgi:transposase